MTPESPAEKKCPQCHAALPEGAPGGLCPACLLRRGFASQPSPGTGHDNTPTPGQIAGYFPNLEIIELLGRGGMGIVYKARQRDLDRIVALKILSPAAGDPAFAERFVREARALARLNHPHIVAIHDFGQAGDLFFLVMEYVDGMNLRQFMGAQKVSPREALAIVPQICEALQYAHDKGIVHRDIKPDNVLLDQEGRVKIADFGLAKIMAARADDFTLTEAGQVMGSTVYMAPEQIEKPGQVDHRADIYSLGVVFYQLLTGELPIGRFPSPSRKVQIDVRLDEVVLRALEKEPDLRFPRAGEIKMEIADIARTPASKTSPGRPAQPPDRLRRAVRRMPAMVSLAALLGVIAAFLAWSSLPTLYVATTTLQLTPTTLQPFFQHPFSPDPRFVENAFQVISSKEVLGAAAKELRLAEKWKSRHGITDENGLYVRLRQQISVRSVRNSDLIEISITGDDPQENAEIANAIATAFQNRQQALQADHYQRGRAQLQAEIDQQREKVERLQQTMTDIRAAAGIPDHAPEEAGATLDSLSAKYTAAKREYLQGRKILEAAEARFAKEEIEKPKAVAIQEPANAAHVSRKDRFLAPALIAGGLLGALAGIGLAFVSGSPLVLLALTGLGACLLFIFPRLPAPATRPSVEAPVKPARISIGGDVKSPQLLPYSPDLTVLRAITAAGGFTEYANRSQVRLLRGGRSTIIDIKTILKDPSLDIPLQPGDSIEVPRSWF